MNEPVKSGLMLLLGGLFFIGIFAFNMKRGEAFFSPMSSPNRRTNPFGFWLIQGFFGVFALALLACATLVLLGLSRP